MPINPQGCLPGHSTQRVTPDQAVNHLFSTPTVLSILARPSNARMSPAGSSAAAGLPGLLKSLVSRLSTPTGADTAPLSLSYAKSKAALHGKAASACRPHKFVHTGTAFHAQGSNAHLNSRGPALTGASKWQGMIWRKFQRVTSSTHLRVCRVHHTHLKLPKKCTACMQQCAMSLLL